MTRIIGIKYNHSISQGDFSPTPDTIKDQGYLGSSTQKSAIIITNTLCKHYQSLTQLVSRGAAQELVVASIHEGQAK